MVSSSLKLRNPRNKARAEPDGSPLHLIPALTAATIELGLSTPSDKARHAAGVVGLMFSAITPVRQSYPDGLVAARERATVLSFDSLLASRRRRHPTRNRQGHRRVVHPISDLFGAAIQALALPFICQARRERASADATDAPTEGPGKLREGFREDDGDHEAVPTPSGSAESRDPAG